MPLVRLPSPTERYDPQRESRKNAILEQELENRWTRFEDIEVPTSRIILTSPNGTRYELTVDDAGVLGTNPV